MDPENLRQRRPAQHRDHEDSVDRRPEHSVSELSDISMSSPHPSMHLPPPQAMQQMRQPMLAMRPPPMQLPPPPTKAKKTLSDWVISLLSLSCLVGVLLVMLLIYMELSPILSDVRIATSMIARNSPDMEVALRNGILLLNTTSVDAMNGFNTAVTRISDVVSDEQVQKNLETFMAMLSKSDFQRIAVMAEFALKVMGAVLQSVGDNGIELHFGNWKAYLNTTDLQTP